MPCGSLPLRLLPQLSKKFVSGWSWTKGRGKPFLEDCKGAKYGARAPTSDRMKGRSLRARVRSLNGHVEVSSACLLWVIHDRGGEGRTSADVRFASEADVSSGRRCVSRSARSRHRRLFTGEAGSIPNGAIAYRWELRIFNWHIQKSSGSRLYEPL